MEDFDQALQALNKAQKEAVQTIEGPVMVVAGPGTGKTQVLALRIAYILKQIDSGADSVLCLTFTRSGVSAMKERLARYIGAEARKVTVATFHSFAGDLLEKYYQLLDFDTPPEMLDDTKAVFLVDEILQQNNWEYIRPRTNPAKYFGDLRGLISILKRERLTPAQFLELLEKDITSLKEDPDSLSTRGASKGSLKKEVEKKIEAFERTKEVVAFYRLYESIKKQRSLVDYDDVLECAVMLAESSEEVRADIQEAYQYVLVDEHQDSSAVQNAFLKAVWEGTEKPNIFVVGDDRQLIYGFSGASISYFEAFKHLFGPAKLITLSENYRSTKEILALADDLLQSTVSKEKLESTKGSGAPVGLYEYTYERDEILGAAQYFKEKIALGAKPEQCALLVPRNKHIRPSATLLESFGLSVTVNGGAALFSYPDTNAFICVLHIINDPFNTVLLSQSLLSELSRVPPLEAHLFLHTQKGKDFSIEDLERWGNSEGLFAGENHIAKWGALLKDFVMNTKQTEIVETIARVGNELLIHRTQSHEALLRSVEIIRSLLHSALSFQMKHDQASLADFLEYIERIRTYNHDIPLAAFTASSGVQIMTLHKSKGLEYDYVWIAHANEETIMAEKRNPFTLPTVVKEMLEAKDRAVVTRELYVALTRAKKECAISYARLSSDEKVLALSDILADLPKTHFLYKDSYTTEKELLKEGPARYILSKEKIIPPTTLKEITDFVKVHYQEIKVSVTLLNNFFECPWKWYFRNFLKIPEVKGASLALGSAVHGAIEYILNRKEVPLKEELRDLIIAKLKKEGVFEEESLKLLSEDAFQAVNHWVHTYYRTLAKKYVSERSIQTKSSAFPHLQLYGKIDLTENFDGEVVVTDFKTGSVKPASTIEKINEEGRLSDYLRQLAMYSYLLKKSENTEVIRSRLLFVEAEKGDKNALYETYIGEEQLDLLEKDIKDYDLFLTKGTWINRPCAHKGYGIQTECEYCALAKIFLNH